MRFLIFKMHVCGMSKKTYSRKIMIDKPRKTGIKIFCFSRGLNHTITTVNNLISHIRKQSRRNEDFGLAHISLDSLYIKHKGYLIGLQHDKKLSDIFAYFKKPILEFDYFYIAGGASRDYHGYKFIVHSNEEIHKNMPHVHVEKDGVSPRYLLKTLERIQTDKCLPEHLRDEKKIIKPYIKKHLAWCYEMWAMGLNGYIPPVENEFGQQFCKES